MVVEHVSALPHESVTINVMGFAPTTGVKQTVPPESVPPETAIEAILPSVSVAENPGTQIDERSQTNKASSPGQVATGAESKVTVMVVTLVSAAPQESVATRVRTLAPTTGVKQTVSPERVPPETERIARLPSLSVTENPGRQISDKSQTNIAESAGALTIGALLGVTVIVVVVVSARPHESVAIKVMTLAPAAGAKQIVSPESVPPETVTVERLLLLSEALNPGKHICDRSQTNSAESAGLVATGALLSIMVMVVTLVSARPPESVAIKVMILSPVTGAKQTVSPDKTPPLTTCDIRLPSGSKALKPGRQMSLKSHTNIVSFAGDVVCGGLLSVIVTVVTAVSVRPQESTPTIVRIFAPTTGVKHTVSPESIPPVTVVERRLVSGSVTENPDRQISDKSYTNNDISAGLVATGALLSVTVTVVTAVSALPQESVAISVIILAPATGVKQTVSPESAPPETVTLVKLPSMSDAPKPGKQIGDKSQTNIAVSE